MNYPARDFPFEVFDIRFLEKTIVDCDRSDFRVNVHAVEFLRENSYLRNVGESVFCGSILRVNFFRIIFVGEKSNDFFSKFCRNSLVFGRNYAFFLRIGAVISWFGRRS